MREKVIDVVFSYTKPIPSRVIAVSSDIRVVSTSKNGDNFTVKESVYVVDVDPSKMDNYADMHVFGIYFRVYFATYKRCTVSPFLHNYS